MRGLVIKDFLVMRKSLKTYGLFLVIYLGLALAGAFEMSFAVAFTQVILMMLPISAFNYDEFYHWDAYAAALPVGRSVIVGGRYSFVLVLALIVFAYNMVTTVLMSILHRADWRECVLAALIALLIGLIYTAIMLPLCYKLGAERARPFLYVVLLAPAALGFLAYQLGLLDWIAVGQLAKISETTGILLLLGGVAVVLGGIGVSYLISCRVLGKKEY